MAIQNFYTLKLHLTGVKEGFFGCSYFLKFYNYTMILEIEKVIRLLGRSYTDFQYVCPADDEAWYFYSTNDSRHLLCTEFWGYENK